MTYKRKEIIGDCTLYLGDCLEVLPTLGKVDAVVTDPPYMLNTTSGYGGKLNPWADLSNAAFWFAEILKKCRDKLSYDGGCIWQFLNWRTLPTIQKAAFDIQWNIESLLVWDKQWIGPGGNRGLRPSYELVAFFSYNNFALPNRGLSDIWRHKWSSEKPSGHPAEKPLSLIQEIIKQTPSETILDPFMGSGTTLVACAKMGRKGIGIELDPKYFDIACKRVEDAYKQADLFVPAPVQPAYQQGEFVIPPATSEDYP